MNHKEFKTLQAVAGTSQSGIDFACYEKYLWSLGYKHQETTLVLKEDKDSNIRFLKKLNRQDFTQKNRFEKNSKIQLLRYAERLKNVSLLSEDFRKVFSITNNLKNAFLYLDVPYFLTEQYGCIFPDSFHVELLDKLKQYRGKWVFSCKMEITNRQPNEQARRGNGGSIIEGGLKDYFKGFLYDFTENEGVYSINMSSKIRKENEFFVLLSGEQDAYSEIMITNFDFIPPKYLENYVVVMRGRNNFKKSGIVSKKVSFGRFLEAVEQGETYKELWDSVS